MAYSGPTYIGKSTALASAASGTIDFTSSGRTSGDTLYIAVETANQAITAPTGFTEVPTVSPQSRGTAGASGGVRITLFEKVSDGTETTVTIADSGDHQYAVGFVFRGTGGTAIEASAGNNEALSGTGIFGGVTTAVGNCLIAHFVTTDNDQTGGSWSAQANANLTSVTERHDAGAADGQGGGVMLVTGEKEVAGATGNTTATQSNTRAYCWITLALKHAGGSGTTGEALGSFTLSGSTDGQVALSGLASGSLALSGAADGNVSVSASAGGSLALSGTGQGISSISGGAAGGLEFTGTATGNSTVAGQAAGSISFSGSSNSATQPNDGVATGSFSLSGQSLAAASVPGTAAGTFGISGTASAATAFTAQGDGSFAFAGSAVAGTSVDGVASGSIGFSGSGNSTVIVEITRAPVAVNLSRSISAVDFARGRSAVNLAVARETINLGLAA